MLSPGIEQVTILEDSVGLEGVWGKNDSDE